MNAANAIIRVKRFLINDSLFVIAKVNTYIVINFHRDAAILALFSGTMSRIYGK